MPVPQDRWRIMQENRYFPNLFFVAVSCAISPADFSALGDPGPVEEQVFATQGDNNAGENGDFQ